MKRFLIFTIILAFSASSFAQDGATLHDKVSEIMDGESAEGENPALTANSQTSLLPNKFLFIDGTAQISGHHEFFLRVFRIEAGGAGYVVAGSREEAAYTFRFNVTANMVENDEGELQPAPEYDNQYILRISLLDNSTDAEILFFDFFFTDLNEMYEYTQSLFHMATVYIPPDKDVYLGPDRSWQNKWLYFRATIDYPISFFALQSTGLRGGGQAAYSQDNAGNSIALQHLNHIILPQPGLTIGAEVQFLDFLGAELFFKLNIGDPQTNFFINMAAGASVKFNIKIADFIIQPYLTGIIPLNMSTVFNQASPFAAGIGVQAGVKGGPGIIIIDIGFTLSFGDFFMKNRYTYAPLPTQIHYTHFAFGIGIGYKYGIINR